LAKSGVVVLSGLTHVAVAMRRLVEYANFRLTPQVNVAALPPPDLGLTNSTGRRGGSTGRQPEADPAGM
jgi:hypothetical protein